MRYKQLLQNYFYMRGFAVRQFIIAEKIRKITSELENLSLHTFAFFAALVF